MKKQMTKIAVNPKKDISKIEVLLSVIMSQSNDAVQINSKTITAATKIGNQNFSSVD